MSSSNVIIGSNLAFVVIELKYFTLLLVILLYHFYTNNCQWGEDEVMQSGSMVGVYELDTL